MSSLHIEQCITLCANMTSMYALLSMQLCAHLCIGNAEVRVQRSYGQDAEVMERSLFAIAMHHVTCVLTSSNHVFGYACRAVHVLGHIMNTRLVWMLR
jgi:hypothetical protein